MKPKFYFIAIVAMLFTLGIVQYSCEYDDAGLIKRLDKNEQEIADIKEKLDKYIVDTNDEILAIREILNGKIIKGVSTGTEEDGRTYSRIEFYSGQFVRIYNGEEGKKGEKGEKGDTGVQGEKGDIGNIALRVVKGSDTSLKFGVGDKDKIDDETLYWAIGSSIVMYDGIPVPVTSKPIEAIVGAYGELIWSIDGIALKDPDGNNLSVHGIMSVKKINGAYYWMYNDRYVVDQDGRNVVAYPNLSISDSGELEVQYGDGVKQSLMLNVKDYVKNEVNSNITANKLVKLVNYNDNNVTFGLLGSDGKYTDYIVPRYQADAYISNVVDNSKLGPSTSYTGDISFTYNFADVFKTSEKPLLYITFEHSIGESFKLTDFRYRYAGEWFLNPDKNAYMMVNVTDLSKKEITVKISFTCIAIANSRNYVKVNVYNSSNFETKSIMAQVNGIIVEAESEDKDKVTL